VEDETMAAAPAEVTGRKIEDGNPTTTVVKKKKRKKTRVRHPLPPRRDGDFYTIQEFCRKRRITESFFHKLQSLRLGPKVTRIGTRVTISEVSDSEWQPPSQSEIRTAASAAAAA
jgi:hypothetical protein